MALSRHVWSLKERRQLRSQVECAEKGHRVPKHDRSMQPVRCWEVGFHQGWQENITQQTIWAGDEMLPKKTAFTSATFRLQYPVACNWSWPDLPPACHHGDHETLIAEDPLHFVQQYTAGRVGQWEKKIFYDQSDWQKRCIQSRNFSVLLHHPQAAMEHSLPNKTSCGSDKIFYRMMKEAGQGLVDRLVSLFNASLRLRQVPDEWRKTIIKLIF